MLLPWWCVLHTNIELGPPSESDAGVYILLMHLGRGEQPNSETCLVVDLKTFHGSLQVLSHFLYHL